MVLMGEIRRDRGTGMAPRWRSDGRWESRWTDASGRRHAVYVRRPGRAGERECAALRDEAIRQSEAGVQPSKMTVAAYVARWVARKPSLTPQSRGRYADLVRLHVASQEQGAIPMIRLQPEDLEDLYAARIAAGCAPKTVQLIHTVIRGALGTAAQRGHVVRNVASFVTPPPVPKRARATHDESAIRRILDAAAGDRLEGLWTLAAQTALRHGELLDLRWSDVDLDGNRLVLADPEKGGVPRTIRLPARTVRVLRAHKARQNEEWLASGGAYEETGLLFATLDGNQLDKRRTREAFDRLQERAGVTRLRVHDMRHAAATFYFAQGLSVPQVQQALGHRSSRTTIDFYGHVTEQMEEQAVAAMDRAFGT